MGKRKKRARRDEPSASTPEVRATTSLGSLLAGVGFSATEEPAAPAPDPTLSTPEVGFDLARQPKVVLQMERKGHGGKTVTRLKGLGGESADRNQVAKALRKALGCGARVDGEAIVIQGDVRDRARTWLVAQGVKKVVG